MAGGSMQQRGDKPEHAGNAMQQFVNNVDKSES